MILTEQYYSHRQFVRRHNISLAQLHEFNHQLFIRLFPDKPDRNVVFYAKPENKALLQIKIREKFKFTTELSMCMVFENAVSDALVIRIYHDAKLAELVYSNEFEKQYREMGGRVDVKNQANMRYSQNCFLNKWLIYLLEHGYNQNQWKS